VWTQIVPNDFVINVFCTRLSAVFVWQRVLTPPFPWL